MVRSFFLTLLYLGFLLSHITAQPVTEEPRFSVVEDQLGSCLIKLSVPKTWNKKVLLLAHGLRSPEAPLTADYTADKGYLKSLADQGWLIASSSYRRNGYIIQEAIEDLEELRNHVTKTYGIPDKIYLQGTSMGGAIATFMAEAQPGTYAGVLTIGPALGFNRNNYSFHPGVPLLMIFNENESKEPLAYQAKTLPERRPALWSVKRPGHCNVTSAEILAALDALVLWSEKGTRTSDRDGTLASPIPSSVAIFEQDRARAKVTKIASSKGNVDTEFTAADLEKLGIKPGTRFHLVSKEKPISVLYGTTYGDVPVKDWVAFILAETGQLRIAVNSGDAATPLDCAVGDFITAGQVEK